jgi:hypothetical protein
MCTDFPFVVLVAKTAIFVKKRDNTTGGAVTQKKKD